MIFKFLVRTQQCKESLISLLFSHENILKKLPSKIGYFSKIEEIFITALPAQWVQIVKCVFSNVAYRPAVQKTWNN